jgi:hypothetical protein
LYYPSQALGLGGGWSKPTILSMQYLLATILLFFSANSDHIARSTIGQSLHTDRQPVAMYNLVKAD